MQKIYFEDLGRVEYTPAWDYQEGLLKEALALKAAGRGAETIHHLLFCEHPPVYTLGKSGKPEHLLASEERLQAMGATFVPTNRGGDITYHGPGQIVGYPILDLEKFYTDLGKYMRALEEVIILTIAHYGLVGERLEGATGVWLRDADGRNPRKICAMGVRCSRWMTMHGWALNVNTDMDFFDAIVPCGIRDKGVTSLAAELGRPVSEKEVKEYIQKAFENVFDCTLEEVAARFSRAVPEATL
jgi:lipoyl(octanoyl) transferase